jgi:hypothetical protein
VCSVSGLNDLLSSFCWREELCDCWQEAGGGAEADHEGVRAVPHQRRRVAGGRQVPDPGQRQGAASARRGRQPHLRQTLDAGDPDFLLNDLSSCLVLAVCRVSHVC